MVTSSSLVLPMFSRLMIVPVKMPGTFKPLAKAGAGRKAMDRLPFRSMLGEKVPSPSTLTARPERLNSMMWSRSSLMVWSTEPSTRLVARETARSSSGF
ncbi:MAG TPA: hypothetical protein VK900_02900 [Anaerolineales bacterium]|nr:hypothetical protein [Anaerolineales bacterium]